MIRQSSHKIYFSMRQFLSKKLGSFPRVKMFLGLGFFEPFQYTINSLNSQEQFHTNLAPDKVQRIGQQDLADKKSRTLYVLGSGPSISSLTPQHFKAIAAADSLGFNFWIHHWFVPNYYLLQIPKNIDAKNELIRLIEEKRDEYLNCHVFLRGDHNRTAKKDLRRILEFGFGKMPMRHIPEFPISPESSIPVESQLRFLDNLGMLEKGRISKYVPKPAGTLGLGISLALQMGYDNIVLLGVDMKDTRHFFDGPQEKTTRRRVKSLLLPTKGTFMDKGFGASHKDWIIGLSKYLNVEKGTKIWLGTDGSSLSGELDRWEW